MIAVKYEVVTANCKAGLYCRREYRLVLYQSEAPYLV